ncbi:MAG: NusG domain II-containing protein [Bacteroidales bacterium]|nr:NusG domain II-containing protein [Bacteroidales bacterium]MCM1414405.1 NusG domain II-containing protein [bacterium]MCM1422285.1 NusG domain II-containing protein [bacterium]
MFEKETENKNGGKIRRADLVLVVIVCGVALGLFFAHRAGNRAGAEEGLTLVISWKGTEMESLSLEDGAESRTGAVFEKDGMRYCQMLYVEDGIDISWYEEGETPSQIPEDTSYNVLRISGTEVSMEAADCPDQICVHHIPISKAGESIICLPHKLVVEIRGNSDEDGLDGMVKTESVSGTARKEGEARL